MPAYVYILTNQRNGTLYIGCTTNLARRITEHKNEQAESFTKKYGLKLLVYVEGYEVLEEALIRERALKKWKREWKLRIIEKQNPEWNDLSSEIA
jgi:putative endonuclease